MTEKQKIQLFSSYPFLIAALLLPLVGFFFYAACYNQEFFYELVILIAFIIIYLVPIRNRLSKKQSEADSAKLGFEERANVIDSEIVHEQKAINSFRAKIVNYSQLKGLTERLSTSLTLEDTTKTISAEVNRLFGDKNTTNILYLFHSKTGELGISSSHKGQMRVNIKSKQGDEFDQYIVKSMQPLLIEDAYSDYRFDMEKMTVDLSRKIKSLISTPLMVGNIALGIIRIDSPDEHHFATEDLRFLTTVGDLGAVAIENAQLHERIQQLAIKDSLTQLYLRRYLLERIPIEITRQMRRKSELSFLMIDLDEFKGYNDKFGHIAGDIVLRTVSKILYEHFNEPGYLVSRYGGEEFSVLLPDCSKAKAVELAEGFRKKVEGEIITLRREKTNVTVSIGCASFPKDAKNKDELIHKADLALYQAKEKGRNQICQA